MGYIEDFLKNQEKQQNEKIPAICSMCGNIGAILYVATSSNKWAIWSEAYKTERKRFMCKKCVTIYDPSLSLIAEIGSKNELRKLPLYDQRGNMLPSVTRRQLESLPHYFPPSFLADIKLTAIYTRHVTVSNCVVLTLIPDPSEKYWVNYFTNTYGFIYTSVFKNYPLQTVRLPRKIKFLSYFDDRDRLRVFIDYDIEKRKE